MLLSQRCNRTKLFYLRPLPFKNILVLPEHCINLCYTIRFKDPANVNKLVLCPFAFLNVFKAYHYLVYVRVSHGLYMLCREVLRCSSNKRYAYICIYASYSVVCCRYLCICNCRKYSYRKLLLTYRDRCFPIKTGHGMKYSISVNIYNHLPGIKGLYSNCL